MSGLDSSASLGMTFWGMTGVWWVSAFGGTTVWRSPIGAGDDGCVRRYGALRRFPCPSPGPRPSPGRRCVGFRFAARSPIGVGDDGRGAISEGGCSSISGVESVSMPRPWAPAFAGATVCRFSRHGHLHAEGRSGPVVRPLRASSCRAEVGLISRLTPWLSGLGGERV